jgi:probable F420-dependent oxidoreductase
MLLGVGLPVSGPWATPDNMTRVAARAEQLGYSSLWSFQRLLHPVEGDLGAVYHAVVDPVAALSYVAAVTTRIRLGIAILNMPYYAPVVLAKMLTTVDIVSRGRLDVGLGLGWSADEFSAVGVPMERRGARGEEFIACLKQIWTAPEVEFHGEFYQVPRSRIEPKPVQQPYPPILLGGSAPVALRRAGRIADGWISSSRMSLAEVTTAIAIIKESASAADRDANAIRCVVRGVIRLTAAAIDGERTPLQGSGEQIREDLGRFHDAGVTEVFLDLNWDPRSVSDDIDPVAALANAELTLAEFAPIND